MSQRTHACLFARLSSCSSSYVAASAQYSSTSRTRLALDPNRFASASDGSRTVMNGRYDVRGGRASRRRGRKIREGVGEDKVWEKAIQPGSAKEGSPRAGRATATYGDIVAFVYLESQV